MAGEGDALNSIAKELPQLSAGMESLKVQHAQDLQQRSVLAQQVENLSQRVNNHDALMTGDGPSVLATAEPVAHPQEWQVQASGSQEAHVTRVERAAMITEALTGKVAPALGALHSGAMCSFVVALASGSPKPS